ncbi:MAG: PAS domain S-box protein [Bacteroidales bacterium]|nr:PAS domain S-box protein [Bacteroidales bacterium]
MKKSKILIVEDEEVIAVDLKIMIESLGYEVSGKASCAEEFYHCIQTAIPDLILMDIVLKGDKDGIDLASEAEGKFRIPVIYITAHDDENRLERATATNPFGYILKPFQRHRLHSSIAMALNKSKITKRIQHLNLVLKAIREVNKLIVKGTNTQEMIDETCKTLIATREYSSAWIVLIDRNGIIKEHASAGIPNRFEEFVERLKHGFVPECLKSLKETKEIGPVPKSVELCQNCGFEFIDLDQSVVLIRIEYHQMVHGYLAISVPSVLSHDEEENNLLVEFSEDLGLAINNQEQLKRKNEAELALLESEQKYHNLVDLISDGIVVHREGKVAYANAAAARLIGADNPSELTGKHVIEFVHPDFREIAITRIKQSLLEKKQAPVAEEVFIRLDGTKLYVEVSAIPFSGKETGSMFVIFTDISERKRTSDSLIKAKEEWEATFNAMPDLIAIIDPDHRIIRVNKAMAVSLGCSDNDIVGKLCYNIVHGCNAIPESCPHARTLHTGKEEIQEVEEPRMGGVFDITTTPVYDKKGKLKYTVHVASNITKKKKTAQALEKKITELEFLNHMMVDRELKMIKLKEEINMLSNKLGKGDKYVIHNKGDIK